MKRERVREREKVNGFIHDLPVLENIFVVLQSLCFALQALPYIEPFQITVSVFKVGEGHRGT